MRELKFRIWDKANKEYIILGATGLDARNGDVIDYYNEARRLGGPEEYEVEQFTGLLDRNGKKIYEGDILETCCGKAEVYFDDELFMYRLYLKHGNTMPLVSKKSNRDLEYEVIGNIHEDKEIKGGLNETTK